MSTGLQPCRSCGHPVQGEARFCQHCGAEQKAAIGEPSTAKIVISFLILILGVPASLIAAYVAGLFGGCTVEVMFGGEFLGGGPLMAYSAITIGVAVFLLCMVAINKLLKSLKR